MSGRYADGLAERARARLSPEVYHYVACGAGDGLSASEAEQSWRSWRFRPRVLRDVTYVELATELLGTTYAAPIGVAPTTLHRAAHPDGEVETARGVARCGVPMVVSSNAGSTFEDIAATGVPWWLQIYLTSERSVSEPVVARAVAAGARALVLTADTPVVGTKREGERSVWSAVEPGWLRVNFPDQGGGPDDPAVRAAAEKATDLGPQDVAWLAARFGLPVVVKGVLHPEDARRCVDAGAAAVWVSHHGGRQLDRAMAPAHALAAVVEEVGDDAEVYVDGGVRSGLDVLTALALGARAVFLGRPVLWALADGGAAGVVSLLGELTSDLEECVRLAGEPSAASVPRELVVNTGS
ncbi:alpha-hydroxy acid oxidase [Nocardioides marmoribigeumensis]|uniref:4-hydroxymandelate oxidase n=1 Tax=Nocardioides marmoribigeumensis TaxID=433649 RepID=A0ABU2BQP0_9ACTN|nr:alpha-hydroxy acid oxidase [Nocardioides marmoribigeumensis]MDR7360945.1 4-hydroxymandelate oxidase [Nocardioides marmoribigeumensis]